MTVAQDIFDGTLQKTLLPKLKKVYPLSFCDIRVFETKELQKIDIQKAIELPEIVIPDIQEIGSAPTHNENESVRVPEEKEVEDIQEAPKEEIKEEKIKE